MVGCVEENQQDVRDSVVTIIKATLNAPMPSKERMYWLALSQQAAIDGLMDI